MRRIAVLALLLLPSFASAQGFIRYYPPASTSGGTFETPGLGIVVDTDGAGTLAARSLDSDGTIVWTNPAGTAGNPSGAVDSAQFGKYASGTEDRPATCGDTGDTYLIGDVYIETDEGRADTCVAVDTWAPSFSGAHSFSLGGTGLTSAADDTVLVSNATAWEAKAVADCDDSGGNHLNYDTATNAWSCGTSSGAASFDPSTTVDITEEFINGLATSGNIGEQAIAFAAISTGTVAEAVGVANHPGLMRLNSHATNDNSGASIFFDTSASVTGQLWDATTWDLDAIVFLGSNGTAITSSIIEVGLFQSTSSPAGSSAISIMRDTDHSHTAFIGRVCDSASSGCQSAGADTNQEIVTSTITPTAGNYYRFRISQDMTGPGSTRKISMRVNNETALTFCSSGCTTTVAQAPAGEELGFAVYYLTRTTTGVISSDVDYMRLRFTSMSRY